MTPIQLVFALVDRIETITKDLRMEESDGDHELRAPRVWAQNLPEKIYEGEPDPADYPFVLVMLGGGGGITNSKATCNVAVLVGGYDDGQPIGITPDSARDRQGWMLPTMLAWRIINEFAVNPNLGPFSINLDTLSWELPGQEQPAPQWFGVVNMVWELPVPEHDFNLGNIKTQDLPSCKNALSDDLLTFMEGM